MIWHPSPNFGDRRGGATPDIVVLHYTGMAKAETARDWLCNPASEVSAHYLIGRDGTLWQMVDEAKRAWHAGAGAWGKVTDVNSRSIGIELSNSGAEPFPEPQMAALEVLLRGILERWHIQPERVIGHSDLAPGRKIDPGPRFDWRRLALQGLAVWPSGDLSSSPDALASSQFDQCLDEIGYPRIEAAGARLAAFRSRFLPGEDGPVAERDLEVAREVAERFPVDRGRGTA